MSRGSRQKNARLLAEERRINKEQEELLRLERELRNRLVQLPVEADRRHKEAQEERKQRARSGGTPIPLRAGPRAASPPRRQRPRKRAIQAKTLALVVIFVLIILLVLNSLPRG